MTLMDSTRGRVRALRRRIFWSGTTMILREVKAAMRGESAWSIGERELMAALIAKWNACIYCTDVHSVVAATHLGNAQVEAALLDYHAAPISAGLKATLAFLEKMTLRPEELTERDERAVCRSGVSEQSLEEAIAVGAAFNLIARYVNALNFNIRSGGRRRRVAEGAATLREVAEAVE